MKRAITEHEVEKLAANGKLTVGRDMILTPGAREVISRKGIQVEYEVATNRARSPVSDENLSRIIEEVVSEELVKVAAPKAPAPRSPEEVPNLAQAPGEKDNAYLGRVLDSMHQGDVAQNRAIVTVVGKNVPGIVARISTVVAACGGDLADMNQVIVADYFSLIFVVNLEQAEKQGTSFRLFKEQLQNEAANLGSVKILVMHEDIFKAMHKV